MSKLGKLALSTVAASLLLAAVVSTASAGRLSVSNQNIRATWASIEFNAEGLAVIRCPLTLEGSFHTRTIAKTARALIGAVTRAIVNQAGCSNGIGAPFNGTERYNGTTTPNTLPWHITYESFTGTLPNITAINLLLSRFRFGLRDSAGLCTGQYGTATDNITAAANREAAGGITTLVPVAGRNNATLERRDGGIFCPNGRLVGTGNVTLLGTAARITVTLI